MSSSRPVVKLPPSMEQLEQSLSPNSPSASKAERYYDQDRHNLGASGNDEHPKAVMAQNQNTGAESSSTPTANLEDRIRGLIMSNNPRPQASEQLNRLPPHMRTATPSAQQQYLAQMASAERKANSALHAAGGTPGGPSTPLKRPNQKQRRVMKMELPNSPPAPPPTNRDLSSSGQRPQRLPVQNSMARHRQTTPNPQRWREPPKVQEGQRSQVSCGNRAHPMGHSLHSPNQPVLTGSAPTYSSVPPPTSYNNPRNSVRPPQGYFNNQNRDIHTSTVFHNPGSNSQAPIRAPPLNRQLYQPHSQRSGFRGAPPPQPPTVEEINAQCQFLEGMARVKVQNAEMSAEEYDTKQKFRAFLESVCQGVINEHERIQDAVGETLPRVTLKCFGSLSSGFATKASDMDLALLSPFSVPEVSNFDSPIPRLLEKAFLDLGLGARLLTRTRVPIIKICEKPTAVLLAGLKKEREKWELHKDDPPEEAKDKATQKTDNAGSANEHTVPNSKAKVDTSSGGPHDMMDTLCQKRNVSPGEATSLQESQDTPTSKGNDGAQDQYGKPSSSFTQNETKENISESNPVSIDPLQTATREPQNCAENSGGPPSHQEKPSSEHPNLNQLPRKPSVPSHSTPRPPRDTSLEFPKVGIGIQCDLNFSNHLALHNTLLLRCYSHGDPRVRPIVIFIKAWAKTRTINSPYHGTLSSYGYVLMVLHYLVNIASPPVIPNLQLRWHQSAAPSGEDELITPFTEGYDVRFWRDEAEIRKLAAAGQLSRSTESLGSLLRGFFLYYAHQNIHSPAGGFNWTQSVLSLRTPGGLLTKKEKDWMGAKTTVESRGKVGEGDKEIRHRFLVAIEDPFETEHNVARTVGHFGVCAIRDEFRRAARILERIGKGEGGGFADGQGAWIRTGEGAIALAPKREELFDEGPDREKLEREAREREWKQREARLARENEAKERERKRVEMEKGQEVEKVKLDLEGSREEIKR